jgi:hypothetical protein
MFEVDAIKMRSENCLEGLSLSSVRSFDHQTRKIEAFQHGVHIPRMK